MAGMGEKMGGRFIQNMGGFMGGCRLREKGRFCGRKDGRLDDLERGTNVFQSQLPP